MPELRRDPIVDRWVIVAEDRARRPGAFAQPSTQAISNTSASQPTYDATCPFCPGNERETPSEVFALRDAQSKLNSSGWRVRVVPNKYPALAHDAHTLRDREIGVASADPLFMTKAAVGVHEVIIDTPRHVTTGGALTDDELADSLVAIRARLLALRNDARLKHALVFKNVGPAAGATLDHLHSQLMATDAVPPLISEELRGAALYFEQHQACIFCRMIEQQRQSRVRIVCESSAFIAFCPYASRFAYEMWILPKRHASHFESSRPDDLADLANLMRRAIAKIERLSQPAAYNLVFHTGPFDSTAIEHYHWHIEVFPRMTIAAGFEWGSGCVVNPVSPETAAAALRREI